MTTALYRRYRPESFADVIGQSHVTEPLMAALRADRVTHAYLFSGPRGCGKTTSARILARCLNCVQGPTDTPCGVCDSCRELSRNGGGSLDVVEIDAASHNGVDDARELRERAAFAPVRDRYKIFILDEAHMVTPQGFNALLKLVEEPPPHVKFIFATTEPERVIGTIRSRTHHYPFRLVPPEELTRFLEELCSREGVRVEGGVLPLVIRAGGGSVRDSLSVLDQLIAGTVGGELNYRQAVALLGYTDETLLDQIVSAFAADDGAGVFRVVERVIGAGQEPRRFVEDLLQRLRDLLVVALTGENARDALAGLPADVFARMTDQAKALGAPALSAAADLTNEALTSMVGATSPRLHVELLCARVLLALGELQGIGQGRAAAQEAGSVAPAARSRVTPAPSAQAPSAQAPSARATSAQAPSSQATSAATGSSRPGAAGPASGGRASGYTDQRAGYGAPPAEDRPAVAAPQPGIPAGVSPADVIASAAADWGDDWSRPLPPTRERGMDDAPPSATPRPTAPSRRFDMDDAPPAAVPAPGPVPVAHERAPHAARQQMPAVQVHPEDNQEWGTREFLPSGHGGAGAQPQPGYGQHDRREHWSPEPRREQPAAQSVPQAARQYGEPQRAVPQHGEPQRAVPQHGEPQRAVPQHGTTLSDSGTAGQAEMIRARWPEVLGALRGISQVTWALVSANAHPGPVTDSTFAVHIPAPGILTAFHSRNMGEAVKQALRESLGLELEVQGVPGGPAQPGNEDSRPRSFDGAPYRGEGPGNGGDAVPFADSREAATQETEEQSRTPEQNHAILPLDQAGREAHGQDAPAAQDPATSLSNGFAPHHPLPPVAEATESADAWPEVPSGLSSNFPSSSSTEPWAPVHDIRSGRRIDGGGGRNVGQLSGRERQQEDTMVAHPSAARAPALTTQATTQMPAPPPTAQQDYDDNEISLDDPEVQVSTDAGVHVMLRVLGGQILEERDLTQN